jgi:hypothetical protein
MTERSSTGMLRVEGTRIVGDDGPVLLRGSGLAAVLQAASSGPLP